MVFIKITQKKRNIYIISKNTHIIKFNIKRGLSLKKIVLISCVSQKQNQQAKAQDLYTSPLFKKNLKYAFMLNPDNIFILSAKYHLLSLNEIVEPYDLTLNNMRISELKDWSDKVIVELKNEIDLEKDEVIFLAGDRYRKYLIPSIKKYNIPMKGLRIGEQLRFLTTKLK